MKILMVNANDIQGGAARAAFRLHEALLSQGISTQMLVQNKDSDRYTVLGPKTWVKKGLSKIRPVLDTLPTYYYRNGIKGPFSPAWVPFSGLVDRINSLQPDVVHLHWVADGMLRIEDIANIKSPIVWTLHDMWPFTGGCHYDEQCGAFREKCGSCKILQSRNANDISRHVYKRKYATLERKRDITLVGPSRWLADEASKSSLFCNSQVFSIPNPIDTKVFSPFSQVEARRLFGLPENKKLILFGAMGPFSDPRKGYEQLSLALRQLKIQDVELAIFGASRPPRDEGFLQRCHYLGKLHDDVALRAIYSAADVMIVPSLQEAFGQTASEAMACGTPVVAFGATGLLDIVDHKENGYLAKPFNIGDLVNGIEWVLKHKNPEVLAENSVEKVRSCFDYRIVGPKFINLYRSIIGREVS